MAAVRGIPPLAVPPAAAGVDTGVVDELDIIACGRRVGVPPLERILVLYDDVVLDDDVADRVAAPGPLGGNGRVVALLDVAALDRAII